MQLSSTMYTNELTNIVTDTVNRELHLVLTELNRVVDFEFIAQLKIVEIAFNSSVSHKTFERGTS